jgi:Mrp family chromosome partitioning ATPase
MPNPERLSNLLEDRGVAEGAEKTGWLVQKLKEEREDYFWSRAMPLNGFVPEAATIEELQLVQKLFFLGGKDAPRVAVFCGVEPTDGAGLVCARAAEVLSGLVKESVCLVDADLRTPTLHLRYDIDDAFRFASLKTAVENEEANGICEPNLWVLPGSVLKDRSPGLAPDQVRDPVRKLRERFGFLLICAPPLEAAAEGLVLGQMADGVVLTVLAHSTQRAKALKARRSLETYNIRVLGVVVNKLLARPAQ